MAAEEIIFGVKYSLDYRTAGNQSGSFHYFIHFQESSFLFCITEK